jgi:hypothetical protein
LEDKLKKVESAMTCLNKDEEAMAKVERRAEYRSGRIIGEIKKLLEEDESLIETRKQLQKSCQMALEITGTSSTASS